jgi:hypothetical protein
VLLVEGQIGGAAARVDPRSGTFGAVEDEGSPKRGIKGVEIHTLMLVTALAKVIVLKGEHSLGQ